MLSRRFAFGLFGLVLLSLLVPSVSWGQVLEEDKDAYVKKGFFFSVEYGPYINILKQGALSIEGGPQASSLGHLGGIGVGFDLMDRLDLHLSFLTANIAGDGQKGGGSGTYLFNLGVTAYFVRLSQLYIFAKVGAGLKLILPNDISDMGLMAHAALGIRYYTRSRHLSVGLEVLALIGIPFGPQDNLTLGLGIMPTLQYTF